MLGDTQAVCIGQKPSECWMEGDVYFQTCSWIWRQARRTVDSPELAQGRQARILQGYLSPAQR